MHSEDIKSCLRKKGSSLAEIARELGVTRQALTQVVRQGERSRRIERAIAQRLEIPLWEVFPDRYPNPQDAA